MSTLTKNLTHYPTLLGVGLDQGGGIEEGREKLGVVHWLVAWKSHF